MAQITVKLKDGRIQTYVKPKHCPITDEDWQEKLGYCWQFAMRQDEGIAQCTRAHEGCHI